MKYTFAPGEAPAEVNGAQQRKAIAGAIRGCLSCVVDDMIANPYSVSRRTYYTYEAEIIVERVDGKFSARAVGHAQADDADHCSIYGIGGTFLRLYRLATDYYGVGIGENVLLSGKARDRIIDGALESIWERHGHRVARHFNPNEFAKLYAVYTGEVARYCAVVDETGPVYFGSPIEVAEDWRVAWKFRAVSGITWRIDRDELCAVAGVTPDGARGLMAYELIDLAYYAMLAKSKADPDTCRFVELDGEVIGRALSAQGERPDPHLIDFSKYTA